MTLPAGARLGAYEVVAPLGAGGMGEVYRARDPRLDRTVAIKVLPPAFEHDPDRLRRFEQEARAAAGLNHPNILAVYDVGSLEGAPFIVSELLDGETLRARLQPGALPPRKALDYAVQMARGLAAAHQKAIVHRDLKPENIFITTDGRVKILDFGLAKLIGTEAIGGTPTAGPTMEGGTTPGLVMGTVGYMSPEQVRGLPIDHRSDIFSFGAILYEMLSGRRAFQGETQADTMSAILNAEPPELAETARAMPPGAERIVRHCLEKSADERFQSVRDIAFDLESLSNISGASVQAAAGGRTGVRWRAVAVVAAVSTVVAVAAVAALGWIVRKGPPPPVDYQQLTFRRGYVDSARFAPDGATVVYSAQWEGRPSELFSARTTGPGESAQGITDVQILGISPAGEMALLVKYAQGPSWIRLGTLARAPLNGGAPREVLQNVGSADWSPDGKTLAISRYQPDTRRWRLEYPIGTVLYETAQWISHVRVAPAGHHVAFLEHPPTGDDRGVVVMVDLAGKRTVLTPEFPSTQGTAWSPSGDEIWFTASRTGNTNGLLAVSQTGVVRPLSFVPASLRLEDVSRSGRVLLSAATVKGRLMVLPPGQTAERDLGWLDYPLVRDISADGRTILFDEEGQGGGRDYSVFIRGTDGAPAVRLGDGYAVELSPDGRWVLSAPVTGPRRAVLLPIGPGEPRTIDADQPAGTWLPDSRRLLFCGGAAGQPQRCSIYDIASGRWRALTPEGFEFSSLTRGRISPDGRWVILLRTADRQWMLWPLELAGGDPRPIHGLEPGDFPINWTGDGKSLYVTSSRRGDALPRRIYTLSLTGGRKQFLRSFGPSDLTGIGSVSPPVFSRDGRAYAYRYSQILADLYVVDGIR